jgi:uncharacterized protein
VGRVEYLPVRPCSFNEFLGATDNKKSIGLLNTLPFPEYGHEYLMQQFKNYTIIGGMPEIIDAWRQTNSILGLNRIYDSLLVSYMDDVEKYASNLTIYRNLPPILRHCIFLFTTFVSNKFDCYGNISCNSKRQTRNAVGFRRSQKDAY